MKTYDYSDRQYNSKRKGGKIVYNPELFHRYTLTFTHAEWDRLLAVMPAETTIKAYIMQKIGVCGE